MDFPLIYCNGDSYSDENYHKSLVGKTYAHVVGAHCNGFTINNAMTGSCNRRIIRSTVHDIMQQRQLNPKQKIIVLIGLSFELRSELWINEIQSNLRPEESNLRTHVFSKQISWRENLLNNADIETDNPHKLNEKFFKKYSEGRAFFFSPYHERINLLTDLVMLRALFDQLNVDFLIFQSPKEEKLESDYLLDFFKNQLASDDRIMNFETFGFTDWCYKQKFTPLDMQETPAIAHYGVDAHRAFAKEVLIPKLYELKIL
jgi:hypothetical protein